MELIDHIFVSHYLVPGTRTTDVTTIAAAPGIPSIEDDPDATEGQARLRPRRRGRDLRLLRRCRSLDHSSSAARSSDSDVVGEREGELPGCPCCRGGRRPRPRGGSGRPGAASCSRCGRGRSGRGPACRHGSGGCRARRSGGTPPAGSSPLLKSIGVCQGRTVRPPRRTRQRIRAGVTGRPFHGAGTASGGIWCASAITSTAPEIAAGESARPLREKTIFGHLRLGRVAPRRERSRSQRVAVDAGAVLGEVHVQPRRLDVTHELVLRDPLVVAARRGRRASSRSRRRRRRPTASACPPGARRRRAPRTPASRSAPRCRSRSETPATSPRCAGR